MEPWCCRKEGMKDTRLQVHYIYLLLFFILLWGNFFLLKFDLFRRLPTPRLFKRSSEKGCLLPSHPFFFVGCLCHGVIEETLRSFNSNPEVGKQKSNNTFTKEDYFLIWGEEGGGEEKSSFFFYCCCCCYFWRPMLLWIYFQPFLAPTPPPSFLLNVFSLFFLF